MNETDIINSKIKNMFDLSKEKIEVKCDCGKAHSATLQDTINSRIIRCTCGTAIKLNDKDGSVRKSITDMNKAFSDLENTFKGFGR